MAHLDTSTWMKRGAYIFITGLVTVALLLIVATVLGTWFNNPPIIVTSLDPEAIAEPLCPGQTLDVHNYIEVDDATALYSYFSVMDVGENFNIDGTQVSNLPRPHPHASTFSQTLEWTVPELRPGPYSRITWFRSTDGRERSIFVSTPFTIGANC